MKKLLVLAAILGGCDVQASTSTDPVSVCENHAVDLCAQTGDAGSDFCYIVFAADCSPEDHEAAHQECLKLGLHYDEATGCDFQWR